MRNKLTPFFLALSLLLTSCGGEDDGGTTPDLVLQLSKGNIGTYSLNLNNPDENIDAPIDKPLVFTFTSPLDQTTVASSVELKDSQGAVVNLDFSFLDEDKTFSASTENGLQGNENYTLEIKNTLRGTSNEKFAGLTVSFQTVPKEIDVTQLLIDGVDYFTAERIVDISLTPSFEITFSSPVDASTITDANVRIFSSSGLIPSTTTLSEDKTTLTIVPSTALKGLQKTQIWLYEAIKGDEGEIFNFYKKDFYTTYDPTPVFPEISDEALLTLIQQKTFRYFYDDAHPASGMARERNSSGSTVTTGGTGFGLMAIIAGIERGFITRQQGIDHFAKVIGFLETADRFHGVWPHWLNGDTGAVQPFSAKDNGGDLVETSFLIQGLLTVRQYLNASNAAEADLVSRINTMWEEVEWDWHTKGGEKVLYWHWSPNFGWEMNHQIRGYNEALITYFLAAASPTHAVSADVYHNGWAGNGSIKNGRTFYDIELPLGYDYGGPLFFAHYSFLGLDPTGLSDTYGDYWAQNVAHSRINQAYCVANPKDFVGYSDQCWGLTASDNQNGYSAHSPTNDLGVITPTAALSSFPYTPVESMKALKFFYYTLGDKLLGENGFYDAFNITQGWTANSYLAIDQGPIVVMIENYRTGLLWDLFMSAPEVQPGLDKLGFTSER
ncbi:MAG: glucoamylase family protein [Imperialibacter sp.]|uniref:glucoamylase family protein n=1 Tax=Imperialibacter sp. TaxID=2038411 RepID=UPI0032F002AF